MRDVKFLVVDDSAMARKLVASVIRTKLGSEHIIQAGDGKEAIRHLENEDVDIIISDWNMVDMDGDELLYHVRKHDKYKETPFVMITTNARRDFIITALQLGVSQYVIKPFTPQELEKKIRSCWSAANKRKTERHSALPDHSLSITVGKTTYEGKLVNLSATGALVRVPYSDAVRLYKTYKLAFSFDDAKDEINDDWTIESLESTGVRLESDESGGETCLLAVHFEPAALPPNAAQQFSALISWLGSRNPKLISN